MQDNFQTWVNGANEKLKNLGGARTQSMQILSAIELTNHVLSLLTDEPLIDPEDVLGEHILELKNAERFDTWFQNHPDFAGPKAAFELLGGQSPKLEAKLYWLKKRSNALMAGAVHFTPNWEDAEWSRKDTYKVGIDFFLSQDSRSLHIALSNFGKLRVLELRDRLTNTDIEVLGKWHQLSFSSTREFLHETIWDSFKLQSVNSKFYNGVADAFTELYDQLVRSGKPESDAKSFSSRLLGRLIFIWFIRKMNLISSEFNYFDSTGLNQSTYYTEKLERLFFRTLNSPVESRNKEPDGSLDIQSPYLNGGLFSPRSDDWIGETLEFPEGFFTRLYSHFNDFNFTTDESTPEYEQVAIDPEMLGRVFESLLASQIEETGEQARKAKGTFYTPREIVSYMCTESLREFLKNKFANDPRIENSLETLIDTSDQEWVQASSNKLAEIPKDIRSNITQALGELKTLDPACGSGAFPLGMLNLLTKLHLRLDPRLDAYKLKMSILRENIFGSDIEPMAVEISRLRSWLSLIVEEKNKTKVDPLPNLEFNFVCANSLARLQVADLFTDTKIQKDLDELRKSYFSETNPSIKRKIQETYLLKSKPDLIDARSNQLKTFNPFGEDSVAEFFDPEVMFGIVDGFDLVLGNPPYVDYRKISDSTKDAVKKYFVGKHSKMINLYLYFFEMGLDHLKVNGTLAYISPQQYLIYENTKGLRDLIRQFSLISLSDFARVRVFDASTYTFVSIISKSSSSKNAKYFEFNQTHDLETPLRTKEIENPIPEPVDVSEFSDLTSKIGASTRLTMGNFGEVFCASSSKESTSTEPIGPKFLAASDIFDWHIREITKYVDASRYSSQSKAKQSGSRYIVTSRMTSKIRASVVEPGGYLGGKINVIKPFKPQDIVPLTAILNSKTINFWYRQKFSMQHMQGGALPVNTTELLAVPVVQNEALWQRLRDLGEHALTNNGENNEALEEAMEAVIFELYDLDQSEQEIILQN